ncbi:MAG TPA: UbiA family prenyltransferase [Bacteroidales bacterium]|nr:UbiA family prenyltransferase [Paludibacter sp.]HOU96976.1 UbiA family prenyltransferase [Bacteroidales bacterium]HPM09904.1 UbiA family prenyltransferase [Paludibacter sp.]HQI64608.1 UbiA family prenyltransferase [Bacteroidales bacterium]
MRDFFKKLRIGLWWNHIVPPIIATIYFVVWQSNLLNPSFWLYLLFFITSVTGFAAFGYFLNDISDIETDRLAGKPNSAFRLSRTSMLFIGGGLFFIGSIPWIWLPNSLSTTGLLVLLILCLIFYSFRPFRLKERGLPGLICDIHYGHILPVFIALNVFGILYGVKWSVGFLSGLLLYLLLFAKGFRNILCHQLEDEQDDITSGIKTFATLYGMKKTARIINYTLAIESVLLILLFVIYVPILMIVLSIFSFVNLLLIISWGTFKLPVKERFTKLRFFLNDIYEEWLPLFLVILVVIKHTMLWWLLPLHLIFFNRGICNIGMDFLKIFKWFSLIIRRFYFEHF